MTGFNLKDAMIKAFGETLLMSGISLVGAVLLGGILGLALYATNSDLFIKNRIVNQVSGAVINIIRSIPFIILLILLIPLSKAIMKTTIGPKAVIVPLCIAAVAFYARLAEGSFSDVSHSTVEAAIATGASKWAVITQILLPEALPSLVRNMTVTAISIIGFSSMAGIVGGGGVGDLAVRYGYQRYETDIMIICVIVLVILVQLIQLIGDLIAKKLDKKL